MTPTRLSGSSALRHHTVAILDQGFSSVTNFLAVLVMARGLAVSDFGVFAMLYTALTLFLGLSRAYFGMPLALAAKHGNEILRRLYVDSISALVLLAAPVVAVVAATGIFASGQQDSTVIALIVIVGVSTPIVMIQDLCRYYAIANGAPGVAVVSDAVWLGGVAVLLALGPALGPMFLIFGWGIVAAVACLVTVPKLQPRFSFASGGRLLTPRRGLRESVAITVLLSTGTTLLMGFLMVPFLGSSAVGTIRGAGTLMGPVNTLIALLDFSVLGFLSKKDRAGDTRGVALVALVLAVVTAAWGGLLLLLPTNVGYLLLGETWAPTRTILPITCAEYVLLCVGAGLSLVFKLRDRPSVLLLNRIVASGAIVIAVVVLLVVGGGVQWMAWSLFGGAAAGTIGMVASTSRERRRFREETSGSLSR